MVRSSLISSLLANRGNKPRLRPMVRCIALSLIALDVHAAAFDAQSEDIADLSLEELANVQVTSVSKRPESLSNAAASIFRSGCSPENPLSRAMPGVSGLSRTFNPITPFER